MGMRMNLVLALLASLFAASCAQATVLVSCPGPDDTVAIQTAVNAAQLTGDEVVLPTGQCVTSSPVTITDRVTIRGTGYASDGGYVYSHLLNNPTGGWVSFNPLPTVIKGTTIRPGANTVFDIQTTQAVKLSDFQISYNQSAPTGSHVVAIKLSAGSGTNAVNNQSYLRDLTITNADVGVSLTNAMEYRLDNVNVMYFWEKGIDVSSPNAPSWGDAYIANSTIWGMDNAAGSCHICITSSGGLRIVNNKLNVGNGSGGSGILINPNLTVQQVTEPLIIVGNSIEGQAVGINIANGNVTNGTITEVSITGNQIWSGINAIRVNGVGTGKWIQGVSIIGNALMVVGGSNKTAVLLDNIQTAVVSGNNFNLSGGGTGWGTYLGTNALGVNIQSNAYGPGLTAATGTTTGNTIGGGSP